MDLSINKPPIVAAFSPHPPNLTSIHHQFITLRNTMMFMRTILALSLAAFTLAVPVAKPQLAVVLGDVGV